VPSILVAGLYLVLFGYFLLFYSVGRLTGDVRNKFYFC